MEVFQKVIMKDAGMIIKGDTNEKGFSFIITDNIENDKINIDYLKNIEIKIKNNKSLICNMQTNGTSDLFNLECNTNDITMMR